MIRIQLHGQPGNYTATVTINHEACQLRTWQRRGDLGHVNATTQDGQQVTLALADGRGSITIGARRWTLRGVRWQGTTMTGAATEAVSDEWFDAYLERLQRRVRA